MKKAWYLGFGEDEIGNSAILVGDPARIDRIAQHLSETVHLPVSRGLKSVTGVFRGKKVTVAAFGMGSPIATIALHELADLGIRTFMRIGTAMYFPPIREGDLVLCETAISFEGTSAAYAERPGVATASQRLNDAVQQSVSEPHPVHAGKFASFDAFYRDMFPLDSRTASRVRENVEKLQTMNVVAADMETSALVNAANYLGVEFSSLCVATVDAITRRKIAPGDLEGREKLMFEIALCSVVHEDRPAETRYSQ